MSVTVNYLDINNEIASVIISGCDKDYEVDVYSIRCSAQARRYGERYLQLRKAEEDKE